MEKMKQKNLPLDLGEMVTVREAERRLDRNRASFRIPIATGDIKAFDPKTGEPTTRCSIETLLCWDDARSWSSVTKRVTKNKSAETVKSAPAKKPTAERVKIVAHLPNGDDVRFEISLTAFSKVLAATIGGAAC